ncbi:hypothetical protein [Nocardioides marmoriginsengisoli]|uniref:hypothetical protein n=1 Tax=Nocardioides marmoriginsengisoli TaxID=661483 RepID=UPI0016166FBE|nr:hypothetical protein [Nocardioides marmoriginsengisoli]
MILHAASRPTDDTTADAHHWTLEGDDYDALLAEAKASVPQGWVLLYVRRE